MPTFTLFCDFIWTPSLDQVIVGRGFPRAAHFKVTDLPINTSTAGGGVSVNTGGAVQTNTQKNTHNVSKNEKDQNKTQWKKQSLVLKSITNSCFSPYKWFIIDTLYINKLSDFRWYWSIHFMTLFNVVFIVRHKWRVLPGPQDALSVGRSVSQTILVIPDPNIIRGFSFCNRTLNDVWVTLHRSQNCL